MESTRKILIEKLTNIPIAETREHPAIKSIRAAHEALARAIGNYERALSQMGPLKRQVPTLSKIESALKAASTNTVRGVFPELDSLDPKVFPGWR
jgi:hypothetical protein